VKHQGLFGIIPMAMAIGTCSSVALGADYCITDGSPLRAAAVKSNVSVPTAISVVPQPVASAPLATPLEARTRVTKVSVGTAFSSHSCGGVIIVR